MSSRACTCKSGTELQWGKLLIVGVLFFLGCALVPGHTRKKQPSSALSPTPLALRLPMRPVKITNIKRHHSQRKNEQRRTVRGSRFTHWPVHRARRSVWFQNWRAQGPHLASW